MVYYGEAAGPFLIMLGPIIYVLVVLGRIVWGWKRKRWLVAVFVIPVAIITNGLPIFVLFGAGV